jgi:hypothetical protein
MTANKMKPNEVEREIAKLLDQAKRSVSQQAEAYGVRPVTALEDSPLAVLLREILTYANSDEHTAESDAEMEGKCLKAIDMLYRAPATKGQTFVQEGFWDTQTGIAIKSIIGVYPPIPDTLLVTGAEAAKLVGVSRATISNWRQAGKLKARSKTGGVGNAIFYRAGDVRKTAAEMREADNQKQGALEELRVQYNKAKSDADKDLLIKECMLRLSVGYAHASRLLRGFYDK